MLYIVMVRSEDGWTAATLHTIDEEGEREPLLSTANINTVRASPALAETDSPCASVGMFLCGSHRVGGCAGVGFVQ